MLSGLLGGSRAAPASIAFPGLGGGSPPGWLAAGLGVARAPGRSGIALAQSR